MNVIIMNKFRLNLFIFMISNRLCTDVQFTYLFSISIYPILPYHTLLLNLHILIHMVTLQNVNRSNNIGIVKTVQYRLYDGLKNMYCIFKNKSLLIYFVRGKIVLKSFFFKFSSYGVWYWLS